jgi:hypothetical protein
MKPYPYFGDRTFNVDAYLDQQLAQQAEAKRLEAAPRAFDFTTEPEFHFRGWAIRLNDWIERSEARIERWLDSVDWRRIDIWLGNTCGFALTGVVLYLVFIVVNAWLSGAIARAVR